MSIVEKEKEQLLELLEKPLEGQGAYIADLVISKFMHNTTVRFFVYTENGATLDECAKISRFIGDKIEELDMYEAGYMLEVSSPGLDRKLTKEIDFKYRVGEKVKITFSDPSRKATTAEILSSENGVVKFENSDGSFETALAEIENAKIVY